ncbi:hypothetical protein HPP92_006998 [Vanilla planifolia]|uniref:Uncharacterized protein n=1 Tax=Vanilla planifolia TaxID=51239 RepID=A0A835VAU7_VANPL|nr:hypothetical protein HPP92_006998 [Vanilla planifolia]
MCEPFVLKLCFVCFSFVACTAAAGGNQGNPADEMVKFVNENRTAMNLNKLHNNPGLGCMALQFISQCLGNCSSNNTVLCEPPEIDITEVYAPNCGVELPTVGVVAGHLKGCLWNYQSAEQALCYNLLRDREAASLLHGRDLTEVGAGFRREKKGAFYWGMLFSNATVKSSFALEEGGKGIQQKNGCFSGSECSAGKKLLMLQFLEVLMVFLEFCFVFDY